MILTPNTRVMVGGGANPPTVLSTAAERPDDRRTIAYFYGSSEDCRRAVACINACEGIETEALEIAAVEIAARKVAADVLQAAGGRTDGK